MTVSSVFYHFYEETMGLILLGQALNNPKSSVTLNEWMDEKLDNKMDSFASVNRFLRDTVAKLEDQNTQLRINLEAQNHQKALNEHLKEQIKGLESRIEKAEAKNEQLVQQLISLGIKSVLSFAPLPRE